MEIAPGAHAVALWAGLNLIVFLALSIRVVRLRRQHGVGLGDGGVEQLALAIRAQGNAAEYMPLGLIGLAVLASTGANAVLIHAAGLPLFAGRLAHAYGLSRSRGASLGRVAGMVATWTALIVVAVGLLFYAIP